MFILQKSADPVIRYLLESGARVNEKDNYGLTPLHYACMRGIIKIYFSKFLFWTWTKTFKQFQKSKNCN